MTDYIKREDAIQSVMNHDLLKSDDWSRDWAEYMLEDAPTIDAVPVVRCRDCVWWTKQEASCQGRCARLGIYPTGAWYCANGAKMDEGE